MQLEAWKIGNSTVSCHCPAPRLPPPAACLQDHLPADPDARKSWQWSKAQKWAMHIATRLFNRWASQLAAS